MFLCLRTIDIHARFGLPRIAFISVVTTIVTFLIGFEIFRYFTHANFSDQFFWALIIFTILLYPLHKLLHLIILIPYYKYFKVYRLVKKKWLPYYNIFVDTPVNKYYFCLALILPLVILTILNIWLSLMFPTYGHYFVFLLALNAGYSALDILYLKVILAYNKGKYVEEHITGFNLLKKV
ncbi:DUF3267 domain-containing protein [Staphylococcus massiliensis]|uniref:DUF3267 domain-containing protein n=1 Tax=Staphylococcus massiliensis S46 TaxID=1229783 RepID=K9AKG9_9STAP|nr:DUF3267 domain-containing protein [Staphylococcus massiliensis]EKU46576.1 hypothetical protein C273_08996 [Staphylococcus massiliensis S46]MCG3400763.1 DUF3267 domain-containing protein [Staphylococcus massiliensis]MCG3412072.1 DUF3267 domain-containing protein [Staphylococcus massiliensis]PNZ99065.1 DUF3267 domain-containing protein [Staphylococcus massiliensis CCUG 55927]